MSFSFNATAGASQSTAKPKLTGNEIHSVVFDGCEIQDIQGVKDTSVVYKVMKLRYSNDDGYYEHTIFEPKSSDFDRTQTEFTNKNGNVEKIAQPSNVESMMLFFKHNIDAFVPEVAKEIDAGTKSIAAPDWEKLRLLVQKILTVGKGRSSKIKLVKDNKGEARFPGFFAGLTKEGKAYIRNNFIGEKIAFSSYEISRMNNQLMNVPNSSNLPEMELKSPPVDLDLDFDISKL